MGSQQSSPQWNKVPLVLKIQFERIEAILGRDDITFSQKQSEINYIIDILKPVTIEDSLICEIYPYCAPLVVIVGLFGPFASNMGEHLCYIHLENTMDKNGITTSTRRFIPLLYKEEILQAPVVKEIDDEGNIECVFSPPLLEVPEQLRLSFERINGVLNKNDMSPCHYSTEIENILADLNHIKMDGSLSIQIYPYNSPLIIVKGLFGPFSYKDKAGTRKRIYNATLFNQIKINGRIESTISYIPLVNIDTASLTAIPTEESVNSFIDVAETKKNEGVEEELPNFTPDNTINSELGGDNYGRENNSSIVNSYSGMNKFIEAFSRSGMASISSSFVSQIPLPPIDN